MESFARVNFCARCWRLVWRGFAALARTPAA
jgi:hypothetical protein